MYWILPLLPTNTMCRTPVKGSTQVAGLVPGAANSTAAWLVVSATRPPAATRKPAAAATAPVAAPARPGPAARAGGTPAPSSPAPGLRGLLALIGLGSAEPAGPAAAPEIDPGARSVKPVGAGIPAHRPGQANSRGQDQVVRNARR